MKLVIIGGVAAGASAATRARRMDDSAEIIVIEKGSYVSFANCGLPYYVGGDIPERDNLLLVSPEMFRRRFHIDVRLQSEAVSIDREGKTVAVLGPQGRYEERYDKLILATGCRPVIPNIEGAQLANVCTVFTIDDVDKIMAALECGARSAVVIGGGFIGLETAEALLKRGLDTTLVELAPTLMSSFDAEFSRPMERHLAAAGLKIRLGASVSELRGDERVTAAVLADGTVLPADIVIMAAGIRPRTELAEKAGLPLGVTGAIRVNDAMQTADPNIYAAGDAAESVNLVSGLPMRSALAGNANRQGRVAGDRAVGGSLRYKGTLGSSVIRLADLTAARTGLSQREADALGLDAASVYTPSPSNAGYYPGAGWIILKITFEKQTGRVLGAQAVGERGVDKRIDVLAVAAYAGLTVFDLENLDLAYAPPYSSARGPEIMAGMVAANTVRGDAKTVTPAELPELLAKTGAKLIDLREQSELDAEGSIAGAEHIPLDALRADPTQLPPDKPYVLYCGVGKRAYNACRFMQQLGYDVYNLTGGYNAYVMDV